MKLFVLIGICVAAANAFEIEGRLPSICYGDLGCFTVDPPFGATIERPIAYLPQSPDKIKTEFHLYTRINPNIPRLITHESLDPLFDPSKPTKFLIHGFLDNGSSKHFIDMKDALVSVGDFNVVIVDWSKAGGNGLPYTKAVANTQVVGAEIARLVNTYAKNYGLNVDDVHIIGHSLGAHTAGYAGTRISGLGRITGLDPAGLGFENTPKIVRLDEDDAKFVDVIHTDANTIFQLGLGLMQRSGDVDFYPNGGRDQPSCTKTSDKLLSALTNIIHIDFQGLMDETACSHKAAVNFFIDSIKNNECKYTAYPCQSESEFNKGNCFSCGASGCNQMGYWAASSKDKGSVYLSTQGADKFPYCGYPFSVTLNSNSLFGQTHARGTIKISLNGEKATASNLLFDDDEIKFKPGSSELKLITSPRYIGETVESVSVSYTKTTQLIPSLLNQDQWSFKNVQIRHNQKTFTFCPDQNYIKSGSSVTFRKC